MQGLAPSGIQECYRQPGQRSSRQLSPHYDVVVVAKYFLCCIFFETGSHEGQAGFELII